MMTETNTPSIPSKPSPDWDYYPQFLSEGSDMMAQLYQESLPFLMKGSGSRFSCVFTNSQTNPSVYSDLPTVDWTISPTLSQIKALLELNLKLEFDYCLVHLYLDGQSGISWHNDKEALNSSIASLSLGATRKFRFRQIHQKNGWDYQYHLKSGDLVVMRPGCQHRWKHCVPVEKTVKHPRMNCTFRQFE